MKAKIILLFLIIIISVSCRDGEVKTNPEPATKVAVSSVTRRAISIPVHTSGLLVSSEEFKLSFKTGGIVAGIFAEEGQHVKKGDLLASLNLSEINANAEQAENGYDKALRDFRRAENLYSDSVVTLEQKQNAGTALKIAKSLLDIARFNLAHSQINAPDNGLILKQFVKANELVSSGYPVFLFGTSGKYWKVRAALADRDIIRINRGDSANVTFDAYPGELFTAVVDQVGEMSDPYTGTYEIELLLNKSSHRLASGFVAGVDLFPAAKKKFSMIPVGSIVEADGEQGYIYILTPGMTVRKVKIEIETFIGDMAAVNGIPDDTDEIVSEGAAYLRDGVSVELVK